MKRIDQVVAALDRTRKTPRPKSSNRKFWWRELRRLAVIQLRARFDLVTGTPIDPID